MFGNIFCYNFKAWVIFPCFDIYPQCKINKSGDIENHSTFDKRPLFWLLVLIFAYKHKQLVEEQYTDL